jgi:hypothetical protein
MGRSTGSAFSEADFLTLWTCGWLLAVAVALYVAIKGGDGWLHRHEWRYRVRNVPPPSPATLRRIRPFGFAAAGLCAVLAVLGPVMPAGHPLDAHGVDRATRDAAYGLAHPAAHVAGRPGPSGVQGSLDDAAGRGRLRAGTRTEDPTGRDRYEVTNSAGSHPVCLLVGGGSAPDDAPVSADVRDGPC